MTSFLSLMAAVIATASHTSAISDFDPQNSVRYAKINQDLEPRLNAGLTLPADLEKLKEAASLYGQDGTIQMRLGQALLAKKEYQAAITAYEKALELGAVSAKFRANCLYDISCAHSLQGNTKIAFDYLEQSMNAGFRDLQHLRTDADLTALHSDRRWETLAATKDVSKMSRDEGWRYDLWLLDREMRRVHFNPYRIHTAAELDRYFKDLNRQIPKLTDAQIYLAFMKYAVLLGDGHTSATLPADSPLRYALPIQLFWFEDGMFVTAAAPAYANLAGAEVLKIDGKTIQEMLPIHSPAIWRDNPQGVKAIFAGRLTIPALNHALGVGAKPDESILTVRDSKGQVREVTLKAAPGGPAADWVTARSTSSNPDPLYLKNRTRAYYFEPLPELKAVYFQYNAVRSDAGDPLPAFCRKVFDYIDQNNVENLILDVRWNGGGNSFLNRNIQDQIYARPRINQRGHFFVITGRNTFSAAQNFTTDLQRNGNPLMVGEPTGSAPNFVGETVRLTLPYSKTNCSISDLYWQRGWPMDHRIWIAPDLPAPPIFSLYKDNRDPAMEVITAYLGAK